MRSSRSLHVGLVFIGAEHRHVSHRALEEELQRLQAESASPEFYKSPADHIHGVLARIDVVREDLDALLARWVELEERGEAQ